MKKNFFCVAAIVFLTLAFAGCEGTSTETVYVEVPVAPELPVAPDGPHLTLVEGEGVYFIAPNGNDDTGDGSIGSPWFTLARAQRAGLISAAVGEEGDPDYQPAVYAGIKPGETVYIRGGVYLYTSNVTLNESGRLGAPITYAAYPPDFVEGNRPIFDYTGRTGNGTAISIGSGTAIGTGAAGDTRGDWLHLYGFDVRGVGGIPSGQQNRPSTGGGISINAASNCTLEFLRIYDCVGIGVAIGANRGAINRNNLIKNCDMFNNRIYRTTGNGNYDGIGVHLTAGSTGNVIYGCRMWMNGDDGYDAIRCPEAVIIDKSWSFWNGWQYIEESDEMSYSIARFDDPDRYSTLDYSLVRDGGGNRGGFKIGGQDMQGAIDIWPHNGVNGFPHHVVRYSLCVGNPHSGFNNNHNVAEAGPFWFNNTAYRNNNEQFLLRSRYGPDFTSDSARVNINTGYAVLKNNLSFNPAVTLTGPTAGRAGFHANWIDYESGVFENNSFEIADNGGKLTHAWYNRGGNNFGVEDAPVEDSYKDIVQDAYGLTSADFLSFDENLLLTPRQSDGSLPEIDFMRPVPGSIPDQRAMGYTSPDLNEDGYANAWIRVGARPYPLAQ